MTTFEWLVLFGLAMLVVAAAGIASAAEKSTKHLSNIADRLLDIQNQQRDR
jgi:hypothetical protein